ncbi:MAG: hypothetical protein O3A65_05690 [Proteobacteria bacterium]|nr:hypothetical protein [Pseudomonadota bacterium]
MNKIMYFLLWINGLSVLGYLSLFLGVIYLDIKVFPDWEVLSNPPSVVLDVIHSSSDKTGLKEMTILLHQHLVDQTVVVNELIDTTIFWTRTHFFIALWLFIVNLFLVFKLWAKRHS